MEAEGSTVKAGQSKEFDVQELLKNLNLHEAEFNDVVLGKEEVRSWPEVKWLVAAKVLTGKSFSLESLKKTMNSAWTLARDVTFHAVGTNLFVIQAACLGDWKRIMEDGPWLFHGCALMLEPFDGATMIPTVIPNRVQAWVQIHKIPPLFRNKEVITQLASRVGEVISVDLVPIQTRVGDFHRARVKLSSTQPLDRFVPLVLEACDRMFLQIKYEKLPSLGHRVCALVTHLSRAELSKIVAQEGVEEEGGWSIGWSDHAQMETKGGKIPTKLAKETQKMLVWKKSLLRSSLILGRVL
ncbi:hypothetical protein ACQ4PT_062512 [Festuca glaucescens]